MNKSLDSLEQLNKKQLSKPKNQVKNLQMVGFVERMTKARDIIAISIIKKS